MVSAQDLLITSSLSDGEAPSFFYVELRDLFFPDVHFVLAYFRKGSKISGGCLDSCFCFVVRLGVGLGGAYALPSLGKVTLDGLF